MSELGRSHASQPKMSTHRPLLSVRPISPAGRQRVTEPMSRRDRRFPIWQHGPVYTKEELRIARRPFSGCNLDRSAAHVVARVIQIGPPHDPVPPHLVRPAHSQELRALRNTIHTNRYKGRAAVTRSRASRCRSPVSAQTARERPWLRLAIAPTFWAKAENLRPAADAACADRRAERGSSRFR